ncbi:MAG: cytochrome P450 [Thermoflexales bacterium]|nr:cytochrome P450 [Thermoflexales bacterium]
MAAIPTPTAALARRALGAMIEGRDVLSGLRVFHAALGDIFRIPLPGFDPIMVAGPEANRLVLTGLRNDLLWRSEGDPVTELLRHGVLVEDGDSHDALRRSMNPALHRRMLEGYLTTMLGVTDSALAGWSEGECNALDAMRAIALRILTATLFRVDIAPDLARLWKSVIKSIEYISPGPWLVVPGLPRPGYARARKTLDDYLFGLIAARRRAAAPGDDLLGLLMDAGMNDDLIRDQLLTLLIAGHDTSTALLAWALHLLARHPDVQDRLWAEIDGAVGNAPPSFEALARLPLLDHVVDETLRLYPPIHLGQRRAARAIDFQGYEIPAGRRVLYSIFLTHRDPTHWPDPHAFRPERFGEPGPRVPYTFVPFGGGARNCIGAAFAQVEVKAVLVRILQRFVLQAAGPLPRLRMAATLEPAHGARVQIRPRKA